MCKDDDIDEQLQKLEAICNEASNAYNFYWDKIEMYKEQDLAIHQDLINYLNNATINLQSAVFNLHTLQRYCFIHHINLTKHWIRLGFTEKQIREFQSDQK